MAVAAILSTASQRTVASYTQFLVMIAWAVQQSPVLKSIDRLVQVFSGAEHDGEQIPHQQG